VDVVWTNLRQKHPAQIRNYKTNNSIVKSAMSDFCRGKQKYLAGYRCLATDLGREGVSRLFRMFPIRLLPWPPSSPRFYFEQFHKRSRREHQHQGAKKKCRRKPGVADVCRPLFCERDATACDSDCGSPDVFTESYVGQSGGGAET
jgi:hypothetical protein